MMFIMPAMPRYKNHIVMIGPKSLPIVEVPALWMKKSAQSIATVMMITMF